MGILDNLNKIKKARKIENARKNIDQKVARLTREDYSFFEEYSTFSNGLSKSLSEILDGRNGLAIGEVIYEPISGSYAKYFVQAMEDPKFKDLYEIRSTAGGHYKFKLKSFDSVREELTKDVIEQRQKEEFRKKQF